MAPMQTLSSTIQITRRNMLRGYSIGAKETMNAVSSGRATLQLSRAFGLRAKVGPVAFRAPSGGALTHRPRFPELSKRAQTPRVLSRWLPADHMLRWRVRVLRGIV